MQNLNEHFYHGTSSHFGELGEGDHIDPSVPHDKVHDVSSSSSIYFTRSHPHASFYADQAVEKYGGEPRVYSVTPTGTYRQDMHNIRNPDHKMTSQPLRVNSRETVADWRATHYRSQ